jgi:hypothetical protein
VSASARAGMAKPNAISRVCAATADAATVPISGGQKTPGTPVNAGNADHVEARATPGAIIGTTESKTWSVVLCDVVYGSELARFTAGLVGAAMYSALT